jgi:hypothetical protein
MELNEIQNMWAQYDKKLAENTRLNKEILKRMLLAKPEKRLQWMRIKAGYRMLTPLLLLIPLLWVDFDFQFTINFFIGLGMFMAVCVYTYIGDVKCFLLIRKINSSEAVLSIKKKIAELEKYKIKTKRVSYMLMPFAIVGILLMLIHKLVYNSEFFIFIALVILVFAGSIYVTFKYFIHEPFRKLNKELAEIVELEQE